MAGDPSTPPDAPRGPFSLQKASNVWGPGSGHRLLDRRLHRCDSQNASRRVPGEAPGTLLYSARFPPMGRSLVLNVSDRPLAVVTARRAVVLVLKHKAEVVVSNGVVFHSERLQVPAPSVVRLRYFVKIPYRAHAALTRRAIFARDGWVCQYCGQAAENLDHVMPRSRGGGHTWENVVAACRRCNSRKENRLPHEVGLVLSRKPYVPSYGFRLSLGRLEPDWEPFLA